MTTETKVDMAAMADELNDYLKSDKAHVVRVATRYVITDYKHEHAGWFFAKDGCLYVKRGKKSDCIGFTSGLLVSIRKGRVA